MTPFRLGLTGSIGMGKSTTAAMFAEAGVPVWDADATVHRLYARGGAAVPKVAALCPDCVQDGAVDRAALSSWIAGSPDRLARLEAVVHPLVAEDRTGLLQDSHADLILFDIPLLYETGAEAGLDAVAVVTAPPEVQRARVLARPGMTFERFQDLLARQMPDADKRARADYLIETTTIESARAQVHSVLRDIRDKLRTDHNA